MSPVTDDAPFFWHFVRFRDVRIFEGQRNVVDLEIAFGERLLKLLLLISVVFGSVFLLLPFVAVGNTWKKLPYKLNSLVYFGALGLGFMFYEVTLIQKLTLLLGYPTYSLTVTLMTVLVFAGVGSMLSGRFAQHRRTTLLVLLAVLFSVTLFYQFAAGSIIVQWITLPLALRITVSVLFVAPLALCLGAFLPIGLTAFSETTDHKAEYIAWCWAMNGFFSVLGSVLSTMLSMTFGFRTVMTLAFIVYCVAFAAISAVRRPSEST